MINYLTKSHQVLHKPQLKDDTTWCWDASYDSAFAKVKAIITGTPGPTLAYYDVSREVTLQVDVSQPGLGAVLLQEGRPVAYSCTALTPIQKRRTDR